MRYFDKLMSAVGAQRGVDMELQKIFLPRNSLKEVQRAPIDEEKGQGQNCIKPEDEN
jgi:hypothetical protein